MNFSTLLLIPVLAVTAACGGSGKATTSEDPRALDSQAFVIPGDTEILGKAYDNDYQVPAGFYIDQRAETVRSYTVHHVLDESNSFELCSDDLVEAQALEAADNDARAVNGYFVTSVENERYFEIVRELAYTQDVGNIDDVTSPGYGRVFKCNHTNRDGVDRSLHNGYSGRLNAEYLSNKTLREFTEYLWQFTFFNVSRKKVIASENTATLRHTLLLALVVNQGADACDRIDIIEWRFTADPRSGEISREFETIRSFEATLSAGIPTFCQ